MKRKTDEVIYTLILLILDALMLNLAWICAYWVRFYMGIFSTPLGIPPFNQYIKVVIGMTPFVLFMFTLLGMYKVSLKSSVDIFSSIIKATVFIIYLFVLVAFFDRKSSYSRGFTLLFLFMIITFLFISRIISVNLFDYLKKKKYGLINFLILGWDENVKWFVKRIKEKKFSKEYNFVGIVCNDKNEEEKDKIIGRLKELFQLITQYQIKEVFISAMSFKPSSLLEIVTVADNYGVKISIIPELLDMMKSNVNFQILNGIPIIRLKEIPLQGWNLVIKKIGDEIIASLLLGIFLPFIVIVGVLIKLTSGSPIIYFQERIGRDGKKFKIYKFRSMIFPAESEKEPGWTLKKDKRITKIGKFLRIKNLDEIPQLINVLKGEMSLVGPRPERLYYIEQFKKEIPRYLERHKVKSGITGWAQVNGLRGDTSISERIKYDLYYIEHWSFYFDFKILLKTLFIFLTEKNL